ncbi:MAG: RNA polymerase sigma-I factor [Thermoanaerobacterales bacterium]|jgi:RNA polymerase sigma factor|nr:RNA polymerase sigma-I factor [Thermoanaerobacterales bacterium]
MVGENLNDRVMNIKNDTNNIEKMIEEYKPFIASVVQRHIGKFVEYGVDDELSIGLMAFHEAIKKYDISKGNFLTFARIIIKNRIIDYYRKEHQNKCVVTYIEQLKQNEEDSDPCPEASIKEYKEQELSKLRRFELGEIKKELTKWGISFHDVAKSSPKHASTKKAYLNVIHFIISSPEILSIMKKKKYLPVEKITKTTKIPRKTVERGRKYIIAAVLIMTGDYNHIKDYIQWR